MHGHGEERVKAGKGFAGGGGVGGGPRGTYRIAGRVCGGTIGANIAVRVPGGKACRGWLAGGDWRRGHGRLRFGVDRRKGRDLASGRGRSFSTAFAAAFLHGFRLT